MRLPKLKSTLATIVDMQAKRIDTLEERNSKLADELAARTQELRDVTDRYELAMRRNRDVFNELTTAARNIEQSGRYLTAVY